MPIFGLQAKERENAHWYVVHCKPQSEIFAATMLQTQLGLQVFLPEEIVRKRQELKRKPLFPGYLFILADLQAVPSSSINTCPGVLRLVEFDGDIPSLSQAVVERINQHINGMNNVILGTPHNFRPGDRVSVTDGPLKNLEMVFIGNMTSRGRVSVLLEFLGRAKEVKIEIDRLEKPCSTPSGKAC